MAGVRRLRACRGRDHKVEAERERSAMRRPMTSDSPKPQPAHSLHRLVGRPGWIQIPKYSDAWWCFAVNCDGALEKLLDPDSSNQIRQILSSTLGLSEISEASMDQVRYAVLRCGLPFHSTGGWRMVFRLQIPYRIQQGLWRLQSAFVRIFGRLFPCFKPNDQAEPRGPDLDSRNTPGQKEPRT